MTIDPAFEDDSMSPEVETLEMAKRALYADVRALLANRRGRILTIDENAALKGYLADLRLIRAELRFLLADSEADAVRAVLGGQDMGGALHD